MLTPERWRQIEQLYQAAQKPTYSAHYERTAENEWTATYPFPKLGMVSSLSFGSREYTQCP